MEGSRFKAGLTPVLLGGLAVLISGCVVYDVPVGPAYAPPVVRHHEPLPPEPVVILISPDDRMAISGYFGTLHQRRDPVSRRIYERGVPELAPHLRRHIHPGRPLPGGIVRESLPRDLLRLLSRLPAGYMWVRVGTDVMIVDMRTGQVADLVRDGARIAMVRDEGWSPEDAREWHDAHRGERREGWSEPEPDQWHGNDRRDHRDGHADRRDDRRDHRDRRDPIPDIWIGRGERQIIADYFVSFGGSLGRAARQMMERQFANPPARLRDRIREGDSLPAGVSAVPLPNDLNARLGRLPHGVERLRVGTDVVLLHRPSGTVLDLFRDGASLNRVAYPADPRRDDRAGRDHRDDGHDARRDDRQEARDEHRDARRDDRQEARDEHRDARRDDRQEARDEHRDARRDDRQEARDEHRDARRDDRQEARRDVGAAVRAAFNDRDRAAIAAYYQSRRGGIKPLPPGISRRLAQGKPLPPGIRSQTVPADLERELSPLPSGHRRVVVGADMVILDAVGNVADLLRNFLR
ncbi:MAG: hypothetical protein OEY97_08810 [Nitrospirota bacterium]|nr:hypothetical protein [Nitrospirota bacterium]